MQRLENRYLITTLHHITSERQTRRARANYRDLNAIFLRDRRDRNLTTLTLVIGRETLQIANRHRRFPHLQMNALALALFFLRTNPTTNSR